MALKLTRTGSTFVVPPGIHVKPRVTVEGQVTDGWQATVGLAEGQSVWLRAVAEYSHALGRFEMVEISIRKLENTTLNGVLLRSITVNELLQEMAWNALSIGDPNFDPSRFEELHPAAFLLDDRKRRRAPDDYTLRAVAGIYRLHQISNREPAHAVGQVFKLQPRTASKWIARARERGYFGGAEWGL